MDTSLTSYISQQIRLNFPHQPTEEQSEAIEKLSAYLVSKDGEALFVLRGYAGTGKTLLVSALVKTVQKFQRRTVLLAPTGRAAKVFSSYSKHPAFTIHKYIYRQKTFSSEIENFSLNVNLTKEDRKSVV